MSSHTVKTIKEAALLIANDVRNGETVFLTPAGRWSNSQSDALMLFADDDLQFFLNIASDAEAANEVIGAYPIETDRQGNPTHIRERLRVEGPSVAYLQNNGDWFGK